MKATEVPAAGVPTEAGAGRCSSARGMEREQDKRREPDAEPDEAERPGGVECGRRQRGAELNGEGGADDEQRRGTSQAAQPPKRSVKDPPRERPAPRPSPASR